MSKIDLQSQVQGVLGLNHGGNANVAGFANEMLLIKMVNDGDITLPRGTVVARTAASPRLHPTTTAGQTIVGVVVGRYSASTGLLEDADAAEDETAAVCVAGRCTVLMSAASNRWDYVRASNTDGSADASTTLSSGTFGVVLYPMDSTHAQILMSAAGAVSSATGATAYATPAIVLGTAAAAGAASSGIRSDSTIVAFDIVATEAIAFGDSSAVGSAAVASRRDHKHGIPAIVDATSPTTQAFGDAASVGAATTASRRDHKHGIPAIFDGATPTTQTYSDTPVVGTSAYTAHVDHKHGMPASTGTELVISDTPSTPLVFADLVQNEAQDDLLYAD